MLIKRKWYRWLRIQLGARSFVKYNEEWEKFPDDPFSND